MTPKYDKNSVESIYSLSNALTGNSLSSVVLIPKHELNKNNKGGLGSLVEKYLFEHQPPNNHLPDFPEAGLELKTTGVLRNRKGEFQEKERLVLTMINYEELKSEEWEKSRLLKKCNLMLLLFYEYEKDVPVIDRKFVLPPLLLQMTPDYQTDKFRRDSNIRFLTIPKEDLAQFRRDWETIQRISQANQAHTLSEGDTFYLAASTKGANSHSMTKQSGTSELAKTRAFSIKPSYLRRLINWHEGEVSDLGIDGELDFEEALRLRLAPYLGMSEMEMSIRLGFHKKSNYHKNFYRGLINRALTNGKETVLEHEKAGILLKTIRLNSSGRPKESMSFPVFNPIEIVNQSWEESEFHEILDKKFLFVVFRDSSRKGLILESAKYWNMPFEDRMEAKRVWQETQRRLKANIRPLPKASESWVAHVRPHARNKKDTHLFPNGLLEMKQSFWLNSSYLEAVLKQ